MLRELSVCLCDTAGGQVGDTGKVHGLKGTVDVVDVQLAAGYVLHVGQVTGGRGEA